MVTNKRKKVTKYRGHTSHGCGHHKKRRGAGSRGGRGRAGSGKRAGHKKYGIVLGSRGFTPRRTHNLHQKLSHIINVGYFTDQRLAQWVESGKAVKEGHFYTIDLTKLGYSKLLGTGTVSVKLKLHVAHYSPSAEEKVKAAGGNIAAPEKSSAGAAA
ncbi:MAG: uL15m family ribosomal protein [Nanoarchaeota archaeon]|nr:uL15m family ribosomal protein [Nanoarchaeota archaeon]